MRSARLEGDEDVTFLPLRTQTTSDQVVLHTRRRIMNI